MTLHRNSLLLHLSIVDLPNGEHYVEQLSDGCSLILNIPGRKKTLGYHTRRWDILLSLKREGRVIDEISFKNVLIFFDRAFKTDVELGKRLVTEALQVAAGAEPLPPDFRTVITGNKGLPVEMSSEYVLKSLKWLCAIEDRYYFSEREISRVWDKQGRSMFIQLLAEYLQGVPLADVLRKTNIDPPLEDPNVVNYSVVNGLRDFQYFLQQMHHETSFSRALSPPGRHYGCESAIMTGVHCALSELHDEGHIKNSFVIQDRIMMNIRHFQKEKGVLEKP